MIIKKSDVWYEGYVPDRILFREGSLDRLRYFLKPVLEGRKAHDVLCVGDFGTGKTACIRNILGMMCHQTNGFRHFYVNCADFAKDRKAVTFGRIITQCLREDNIKGIYPTLPHEIKVDLFKKQMRSYPAVIIVLDEIDYWLAEKNNDFEAMAYAFSRSLMNCSLVLITNKFWVPNYLSNELDTRVQDTFTRQLHTIAFSDYTEEELFGILCARAEIGFNQNGYSVDILEYISHISYINMWRARGVINIARDAAELADDKGDDKIDIQHVNNVAEVMPQKELKKIIKALEPPAFNILLYFLKYGRKRATEGDVMAWFMNNMDQEGFLTGNSRRTFYNALSRLKGMNLIESEIKGRGRGMGRYAVLTIPEQNYSLIKESMVEFLEIKSTITV